MYSYVLIYETAMVFLSTFFFPALKPAIVYRGSSKCYILYFFREDLTFHYRSRKLHENRRVVRT